VHDPTIASQVGACTLDHPGERDDVELGGDAQPVGRGAGQRRDTIGLLGAGEHQHIAVMAGQELRQDLTPVATAGEAFFELLVGAFIVYLFYMEFVEPTEALMAPVWERLWESVRGCVPW